jgi:exopolysaccharide biosynthesis polyprenyl glycosylphosphotransferase
VAIERVAPAESEAEDAHDAATEAVAHDLAQMVMEPDRIGELPRSFRIPTPLAHKQRRRIGGTWVPRYQRTLAGLDFTAVLVATLIAYVARFGAGANAWETAFYSSMILVLPLLWVLVTVFGRGYESRYLGVGSEEFQRVAVIGLFMLALISTVSYGLRLEVARGFVLVAVPLSTILVQLGRYAARKWLHTQREHGRFQQKVIAVGHLGSVQHLVERMRGAQYHGMDVVAACVPSGRNDPALESLGVPVVGDFNSVASAVRRLDADVVAVLPSPELGGAALRRLGWALEDTRADLLVAPSVVEVVGPRIAIRPVCGLPLLHVERPEIRGVRQIAKSIFDRSSAVAAILLLSPLLLGVALAIKATSRGPVFFRQERIGRSGQPFTMWKFRSMVINADELVAKLAESNDGKGVLFKMKRDPRVTRVGAFIRRYSIDELPQLFNVVIGDMSLVGPRPPLRREVEQYSHDVRRRLMVKPGLTGLWQINGRSDLDWDEAVRLDLRYVENWSFAFDLMIIWKTLGAVLASRGAY